MAVLYMKLMQCIENLLKLLIFSHNGLYFSGVQLLSPTNTRLLAAPQYNMAIVTFGKYTALFIHCTAFLEYVCLIYDR